MRIKRVSATVESQADMARMRKEEAKYKEVLVLMNTMMATKSTEHDRVHYNNMPFATNSKFSGRLETVSAIHKLLDAEGTASSLKSAALFGMGGVGKTQIAAHYAYESLDHFDVVLWIAADNTIAIG